MKFGSQQTVLANIMIKCSPSDKSRGPRRATTSVTPRAPRVEAMGQRVYKPLLGVADTNHLLSIHIWVMLGNVVARPSFEVGQIDRLANVHLNGSPP